QRLGLPIPIETIAAPEAAPACFVDALPVIAVGRAVRAAPGKASLSDAPLGIEAIARAVADVQTGRAAALVTNPINKDALYRAGFRPPGHTEYLAELAGGDATSIMMLAGPELRVV